MSILAPGIHHRRLPSTESSEEGEEEGQDAQKQPHLETDDDDEDASDALSRDDGGPASSESSSAEGGTDDSEAESDDASVMSDGDVLDAPTKLKGGRQSAVDDEFFKLAEVNHHRPE